MNFVSISRYEGEQINEKARLKAQMQTQIFGRPHDQLPN